MPRRLYRATLTTEIVFWGEDNQRPDARDDLVREYAEDEGSDLDVEIETFDPGEALPRGWDRNCVPLGSTDSKTLGELEDENA